MIMFIRYAELAAAAGGHVIFHGPSEICRLLKGAHSVHETLAWEEPRPSCEYLCPLGSFPLACGTTLQSIPSPARYLESETDLRRHWHRRIKDLPRPRIGICWQGNSNFPRDKDRSIPLAEFRPLLDLPVTIVNVHKGEGEIQIHKSGLEDRVHNFSDEIHDFADTAALMDNLDQVITSDTSVAHLAGALGRPTWVLLQRYPEWRWLLDSETSPWYPSVRLFQQKTPGDWGEVIDRVNTALDEFTV